MQEGDILSGREARYVDELERLWDMLSDAVEDGKLDTVKDEQRAVYLRIVRQMRRLQAIHNRMEVTQD